MWLALWDEVDEYGLDNYEVESALNWLKLARNAPLFIYFLLVCKREVSWLDSLHNRVD